MRRNRRCASGRKYMTSRAGWWRRTRSTRWIVDIGKRRITSMTITKQTVADQIAAYLHHRITLEQLVDWAENALMEADFEEKDAEAIAAVISRLGVADVRAFGLAWDDCEELLRQLGFTARVDIVTS